MISTTGRNSSERRRGRPAAPSRVRAPDLRGAAAAFTLLELILVLVIACTVLGLAAPSLRGFWSGSQTKDAVHHVLALVRWARSQAAADARVYRLYLDEQGGTFWLAAEERGAFVPLGTEFGRIYTLPPGARFELTVPSGYAQGSIDFYPDGRATPASIRIVDPHGEEVRLLARSPTERLEVVDGTVGGAPWR